MHSAKAGWYLVFALSLPLVPGDAPAAKAASPNAGEGAAVLQKFACANCHRLGGVGEMIGPELDQVTLRRSRDWIFRWLGDPPKMKPGTLMPKFPWQAGERESLIAYLSQFAVPVNGPAIVKAKGRTPEAGEALVKAYGCQACHRVGAAEGRTLYPDLTTLKLRRTPAWEKRWLAKPEAIKSGTFMPDFHLGEAEIDAIVAYLFQPPRPPSRDGKAP